MSGLACLHLTAATTCLGWRGDLVVALGAQVTDLRAGLWMGPSSHRTDLWAEAASRDEVVVTSVLAAVYHALKSTAEQRLCAIGASRWPLVVAVGVVGAGATSGTLRPGPGGPPGPTRARRRLPRANSGSAGIGTSRVKPPTSKHGTPTSSRSDPRDSGKSSVRARRVERHHQHNSTQPR